MPYVNPSILWTDEFGLVRLTVLGLTFSNWVPDIDELGESEVPVGNSRTYFYGYRRDYTAAFDIIQIANTEISKCLRLKSWLVRGGVITIYTQDSFGRVYTAYVKPKTIPTIDFSDADELEYTMHIEVVNVAASPLLYTPFPAVRTLPEEPPLVGAVAPLVAEVMYTDSMLQLPDGAIFGSVPGDWTMEAWVNVGSWYNYDSIIAMGHRGDEFLFAHWQEHPGDAGMFKVYQSGSGGDVIASTPGILPQNVWSHIAVSRRSSDGKFSTYVNGTPDKVNASPLAAQTSSISEPFRALLGDGLGEQLQGMASDVRVWNTVRTATEIHDNYNKRLLGSEAGLIGYWKLDTAGGVAIDSSPSGADATLVNAPHARYITSDGPVFVP